MFLSEIPHALVRCWYVVLVGLVGTFGLVVLALQATPKEYSVTAETLLLPPATSVPAGENPYLSLGGLNAVGDILRSAMQDEASTQAMTAAGLSTGFTFARDANSAAPMMLLTVTGGNDADTVRKADIVLKQIPVTLADVQARTKVPENSYVTSTVVVRPDHATVSGKGQIRSVLVALAAGVALTLLLTALVDAFLRRRFTARSRTRKRWSAGASIVSRGADQEVRSRRPRPRRSAGTGVDWLAGGGEPVPSAEEPDPVLVNRPGPEEGAGRERQRGPLARSSS